MSESLERVVGQAVVALLNKDATLAALPAKYSLTDNPRQSPQVRVRVVRGERQYEGPRCDALEVTVTVRSNEKDADQMDDLCARVDAVMEAPDTEGVDLSAFAYLGVDPEQQGDWNIEDASRERTRTYPFLVKAA